MFQKRRLELWLLLANSIASCAQIQCYGSSGRVPHVSDCLAIVAHFPSALPVKKELLSNGLSPSSPFLPQATLEHESCAVDIRYASGDSTLVLHEATIFRAWNTFRAAAHGVVDVCVRQGRGGHAVNELRVSGAVGSWYVTVVAPPERGVHSGRLAEKRVRAMNGVFKEEDQFLFPDLFGQTFYNS